MQNSTEDLIPEALTQRRVNFEQVATAFNMAGSPVSLEIEALMKPLLDGTMTYEEHRVMLQAMLKAAGE